MIMQLMSENQRKNETQFLSLSFSVSEQIFSQRKPLQSKQQQEEKQNLKTQNIENSGQSTEKGIPIPRNMLSISEDAFQLQEQSYHQNELKVQEARALVDELELDNLLSSRPDNTKNVLRNFGNAQNQYALYHREARAPFKFDSWVRTLKLENFQHFKKVWTHENKVFARLYQKICWNFYTNHAIPYVLSSRMKNHQTKNSHLKYIYRFLEGIKEPSSFNFFKRKQ